MIRFAVPILPSLVLMLGAFAVRAESHKYFLFDNPEGHQVVHLDAATIDSVGTEISNRNMDLVNRIDTAFHEGRYGDPDSDDSRREALAALIYNSETAFDFFLTLALQDDVIFSTSEPDLMEAFTSRFRNPGLYPIVNLVDARAGFGHFCVMFEVERDEKRDIVVSGEKMSAWTEKVEIDDTTMQVVNIDMKTLSHDRVHVVYEEYSCGAVRTFDLEVGEQPLRIAVMEGLHGQYVRKWGFHRPAAVVLWKSPGTEISPPPADARYLGSAIYFPKLQLELPWFLPDIGFDDLRRFDFPEALLSIDAVNEVRERKMEWLEIKDNYRFANWEGEGEIPEFVHERFPDY
jgi:hypothetical protein